MYFIMEQLLLNPYIIPPIKLGLAVYGGAFAPPLPAKVKQIITSPIPQFILMFLVLYIAFGIRNLKHALAGTIIIIVGVKVLNYYFGNEGFDWENPNIFPGCLNITWQDILQSYGGDKEALRRALFNTVNTNYTSAPEAATQLINKGHFINDTCKILPNPQG